MTFKRGVFWAHLVIGVTVGLVVLTMSVTGILLTYERQIEAWAVNSAVEAPDGAEPLDLDALVQKAEETGAEAGNSLTVSSTAGAAVKVTDGRREKFLMNPYTGERMENAGAETKAFFRTAMLVHRWFALAGENREIGKAVTGAANLGFLFLIVSGFYLWWPKKWKWRIVRQNLFFRSGLPTAKARDYNWHHVFGIWALVPLFAVVLSGVVISYDWAGSLIVAIFGEATPAQAGRAAGAEPVGQNRTAAGPVALQALADALISREPGWQSLTVKLPNGNAARVTMTLDTGNGAQLARQKTYTLSRMTGEELGVTGINDQPAGRRARIFLRFLHTGEVYGLIGQTLAGLGSLASLFLVYTGFALAWRRLIQPLFRRRAARV